MIFQMHRAVGEVHGVDRAAPLVRAVEQQRHGVGDGTEQQQNGVGRRRVGHGRFGQLDDIDGGISVTAQKEFRAVAADGIDCGRVRLQIRTQAGDGKHWQFREVVAVAGRTQLEIAQRKCAVADGRDAVRGVQRELVIYVQRDRAIADFKLHEVLIQRRVFVQGEIK